MGTAQGVVFRRLARGAVRAAALFSAVVVIEFVIGVALFAPRELLAPFGWGMTGGESGEWEER